ncbi:MAG: phosphoenolpyruvate--protein phosphotransferase [bacterium]
MDHMQLIYDIGELSGIFAESASIETVLQRIVVLVAEHVRADVCSIYIFDEEAEELLLKATKGLHPDSVDRVRLKLGEGIAGFALQEGKPICERKGSTHPRFKFFPGIFEERYEAFLAVPMLRGIARIGVLVVQREQPNCFKKQDVMLLRTVASQLCAIIENARLLMQLEQRREEHAAPVAPSVPRFIKGKAASEGFAYAEGAVLDNERSMEQLFNKAMSKGAHTLSDFDRALVLSEKQLEDLQEQVEERLSDVASLIFAAHLMVLKDKGFVGRMRTLIEQGMNPADAIRSVAQEYIGLLSQSPSPYIREKAQDVQDLVIRIMRNLLYEAQDKGDRKAGIVVAKELFPSDLLKLSSEQVEGIVLVSGGVTSHLSILARSLRVPLVIADVPELLSLPENTRLLLDAELGNVYVDPSDDVVARFRERNEAREKLVQEQGAADIPAATADGTRVRLMANINLLTDLTLARDVGADGIGLYRTEFPFLIRSTFPTEEEQFIVYRKLIEGMKDKEITLRTLDIGGDKVLSYFHVEREQNPFLGMRSIRFSLHNQEIFTQQIRAMLRAGAGASIRIMFPMISSVDEFRQAREILAGCIEELEQEGLEHNANPKVGMMVEIPSVVDIIDELAREADFFSIGTNDFIQYLLAVDRTNEKVASLYLPHHPSVLRSLKRVADAATQCGIEASVCGDMAQQERYVPFLLGIGIRTLSVDPVYCARIKRRIAGIHLSEAEGLAQTLLEQTTVQAIERILPETD